MKNKFLFILFFILAFGFISAVAITDDLHLNIQTTDTGGNIVTGTFDFVFNISNTSDCSNIIYTNSTSLTTDSRGIISYYLPNVSSLDYDQQYWLCYYRGGQLISNSKIARIPYAFRGRNVSLSGIEVDSNFDLGSYNFTTLGYVGIGTGSPAYPVEVYKSSSHVVFAIDSDFGYDPTLMFMQNGSERFQIYIDDSDNDKFKIYNYNIEAVALTIDNTSNNVGIGTDSPSSLLHVSGDAWGNLKLEQTVNNTPNIAFVRNGTNRAWIGTESNVGNSLIVETTGDELSIRSEDDIFFSAGGGNARMVIDKVAGNVGIGTATPSQKLDVLGAIQLSDNSGSNEAGVIRWTGTEFQAYNGTDWNTFGTTGGGASIWSQNESDIYYNNGNVGIGTGSPDDKLDIRDGRILLSRDGSTLTDGNTFNSYEIKLEGFYDSDPTEGVTPTSVRTHIHTVVNADGSYGFAIADGVGDRLTVKNGTGNVGIGTTSPDGKLEIFTNVENANVLNFNYTADGPAGPGITMYRSRAGTTSVESDDVIGNIRVTAYNGSEYISFSNIQWRAEEVSNGVMNSSARFALVHQNAQTEIMRLLSNGKVGIGTTSPGAKLDILDGDIRITVNSDVSGGQYFQFRSDNAGARNYSILSTNDVHGSLGGGDFAILDESRTGTDANQTRFLIDSSGDVGIGTTSPFTGIRQTNLGTTTMGSHYGQLALLDDTAQAEGVGGAMFFGGKYTDGGTYTTWSAITGPKEDGITTNFGGELAFWTRPDGGAVLERMRIDAAGNVGIGTTTPKGALHIQGPNNVTQLYMGKSNDINSGMRFLANSDNNNYIQVGKNSTDPGAVLVISRYLTGTSNIADFNVYADETYFSGSVGIGTASPTKTLEVDGDTLIDGAFAAGSSSTASGIGAISLGRVSDANGYAAVSIGAYSGTTGDYSVSIGYYADAKGEHSLAIGREIEVSGNNSVGIGVGDPGSDYTVTQNNVMAIMGGNVGIGTASPDYKLEIAGTSTYAESDAAIELYRNAATSNGNYVGTLRFTGKDSASNEQSYVKVLGVAEQTTSGSEHGGIKFLLMGNDPGLMDDAFRFHYDGTAEADIAWNAFSPYLVMQYIPEDAKKEDYEIGDIVIIKDRKVLLSTESYQTNVLGVIVPREGFISTPKDWKNKQWDQEKSLDEFPGVPVAYIGDVKVKVSTENGLIESGDPLVSSSIPGVGMKGEPDDFKQYSGVIGKAREPFNEEGIGLIEVALGVK